MEKNQISTYALGSSLTPKTSWWENHEIQQRELNFFQFRKNAFFTSLICEDLARNDPCHSILRSVAPNLVFALLMDGPQMKERWSARYAGTLADDPGSAVLTLTSGGLIRRSNENTTSQDSFSIGLLRDCNGETTEISLPYDGKGILLTLTNVKAEDKTIDMRPTTIASSWHYLSQKVLKLNEEENSGHTDTTK